MMGKKVVGIDFGTSTIKMYRKGTGVVLNEKNVVPSIKITSKIYQ